jgi:hypothetical protein
MGLRLYFIEVQPQLKAKVKTKKSGLQDFISD